MQNFSKKYQTLWLVWARQSFQLFRKITGLRNLSKFKHRILHYLVKVYVNKICTYCIKNYYISTNLRSHFQIINWIPFLIYLSDFRKWGIKLKVLSSTLKWYKNVNFRLIWRINLSFLQRNHGISLFCMRESQTVS